MTTLIFAIRHARGYARDWHPLVALAALYLVASAIAPEFGI
ncbi:conserved protein of unknown function [Burkholderia multivorans]